MCMFHAAAAPCTATMHTFLYQLHAKGQTWHMLSSRTVGEYGQPEHCIILHHQDSSIIKTPALH